MSQKEEQRATRTARWWSILKPRRQGLVKMLQSAKKKADMKRSAFLAQSLLQRFAFSSCLSLGFFLSFWNSLSAWQRATKSLTKNEEAPDNQGPAEQDEYYSSKCPEEFAIMIYPEWYSNQDIDCSCDFTEYEGDCCVFDLNENERICGCGLSVLRCTSCEMCSTPDLCYSVSLEASYERKPGDDWPPVAEFFNSTICMTTNQIPLKESWTNYTLVPLKEPSTLCVTLTDHWILTKNFNDFSSCTSASLDGHECDECSKSICKTDDEQLKSVRVRCGYPDHDWGACVASDRLPHPHHPWFNRIRDELIDDQSIARTYPPWGNGTCVKEWYGKAIRPSTRSKRASNKKDTLHENYIQEENKKTNETSLCVHVFALSRDANWITNCVVPFYHCYYGPFTGIDDYCRVAV